MQKTAALIPALGLCLQILAFNLFVAVAPAAAQDVSAARSISWVEEWDPATQRWVRVEEEGAMDRARADKVPVVQSGARTPTAARMPSHAFTGAASAYAARFAVPVSAPAIPQAIAQYGPFLVIDARRAALVGSTDSASPHYFDAMLSDFPALERLEMIEAPGTSNDIANLAVGRRLRAAGIATHVPRGGSVRSGAVELFLAGKERTIDQGAQFAVHAWMDNYGREPGDFTPDAPANRLYLDYYREMGMSEDKARAFYAMTNSVPHASAKWLGAAEMRYWSRPEARALQRKTLEVIVPRAVTAQPLQLKPAPLCAGLFAPAPSMVSPAPMIGYANLDGITLAGLRAGVGDIWGSSIS